MAEPLISVIVPTRNRHHLLPRALQSLFDQTLSNFEVIVVDDNPPKSRVRTAPKLVPLLADPRLVLIENEQPKNAARARNRGLHASRGQWITYLDDDDAYAPIKLAEQLQAAEHTGLPLGLCGLAVNLPGRRRLRQVGCESFSDAAILLDSLPDTKVIFHRRRTAVTFNEDLDAAEDAYYFFSLVQSFGVEKVFNVPKPLVEVFPQPGTRVNLNGAAIWQTSQAICRDFGHRFGAAAGIYLTRAELQSHKFRRGEWSAVTKLAFRLWRARGRAEWRTIANTLFYKIPLMRRLIVS